MNIGNIKVENLKAGDYVVDPPLNTIKAVTEHKDHPGKVFILDSFDKITAYDKGFLVFLKTW